MCHWRRGPPGGTGAQVSVGVVVPVGQALAAHLIPIIVRQTPFIAVHLFVPFGKQEAEGPDTAIGVLGDFDPIDHACAQRQNFGQ